MLLFGGHMRAHGACASRRQQPTLLLQHSGRGVVALQRSFRRRAVATDFGQARAVPQGDQASQQQPNSAQQPGRTILLAVDESPESEYALDWALTQLHRAGDSFKLMHCVPTMPPGRLVAVAGTGLLRTPHVDPALLAEKAATQANGKLAQKLLAQLKDKGVEGTFEVLRGPAADSKASISAALCTKTQAEGAAAVVIGSQSRGGLKEALLGSIAANLAHNCEAPVVILHKPKATGAGAAAAGKEQQGKPLHSGDVAWLLSASTQELLGHTAAVQLDSEGAGQQGQAAEAQRSLVVAIDDSEEGLAAVGWVLLHLWRPGDVLHLLHVVPALPAHMSYSLAPDGMLYSLPLPQLEEAQVEESHWRELLMERFGPLLQANQVQFQLDVLTDYGSDPLQGVAAAVVSTAERLGAAALVVCGHSKGTFAEWLLGSVSDWAVHHSDVPVVVLHGSKYTPDAL